MSYNDVRLENQKAVLAAEARDARERTQKIRRAAGMDGPREWAWKLRERELSGEKLSPASAQAWRTALASEIAEGDA